jgi:hypothetical protein
MKEQRPLVKQIKRLLKKNRINCDVFLSDRKCYINLPEEYYTKVEALLQKEGICLFIDNPKYCPTYYYCIYKK